MISPIVLILAGLLSAGGLDQIRQETNPGKRSEKVIQYSQERLTAAREYALADDQKPFQEILEEVAEGAELALSSLEEKRDIGKTKKAELRCREILRRLETLRLDLPVENRAFIEKIMERVHHVQDELVTVALRKKRK